MSFILHSIYAHIFHFSANSLPYNIPRLLPYTMGRYNSLVTCTIVSSVALPAMCCWAFSHTSAAMVNTNTQSALRNSVKPFYYYYDDDDDDIELFNAMQRSGVGYDVSSARGWMEYIEQSEGPKYGVGAYTVIRCDASFVTLSSSSKATTSPTHDAKSFDCEWKIWGEQFHLDRLSLSFNTLTENLFGSSDQQQLGSFSYGSGISSLSGKGSSVHTQSLFRESKEETKHVIRKLLEQATRSIHAEMQQLAHKNKFSQSDSLLTQTLMLTILWTPSKHFFGEAAVKPIVRGHAAFANEPHQPTVDIDDELPIPITASVAIPKQLTAEALSVLPHRHGISLNRQRQVGVSASAKLSSWCRIRRPLEDPNRYKPTGVSEVVLVRQKPDTNERGTNIMSYPDENFINKLEFLEGLISNLFVVYKDGTVRTAPTGLVLPGYARHLIIQELNERELRLDSTKPPTMQDMMSGLWSEVFVTSAIRLVIPVERIIMPAIGPNNANQPSILWEAPNDYEIRFPVTKAIRSAMFHRGCSQATVQHLVLNESNNI